MAEPIETMDAKDLISYSQGGVTSKVIHKSERMNVTLFCMAKGTDISEHTSAKEGMVYVIEGNGEFTLFGKEIKMLPEIMIFMPKSAPHSLKAHEDTSFILYLS